ncbi:MAG: signal recognition particle-docking protein FtsY [Gammaproteobacteria bacterium]|nr:signal recognition particle-docking protein FtsY [Gammaproteobacteria bacterium]
MFSFFKKKPAPASAPADEPQPAPSIAPSAPAPSPAPSPASALAPASPPPATPQEVAQPPQYPPVSAPALPPAPEPATPIPSPSPSPAPAPAAFGWLRNPFATKTPEVVAPPAPVAAPVATPAAPVGTKPVATAPTQPAPAVAAPSTPAVVPAAPAAPVATVAVPAVAAPAPAERKGWLDRLKNGLRKTGSSITTVFTGTQIDDALYEELEEALLMADTGVKATTHLLADLKRRVKDTKTTDPAAVKGLLADALADLLRPLEKALVIGEHTPTVIMVAGVNGAGKTTSIGKLTKHLADEGAAVLLAAADTFRAAAREQLGVWADRNTVEIVSQEGGDPAAVSYDAVTAGKARGKDVVLVDTAGRLPTQLHLMEELRKIRRVVTKADATAPHEVLLVIDGNTGQNALAQVRSFDDALQLTGLIVTKLDGTAKGGVLAAIAQERPIPVYFIGVGEKLEDLETFNAREFAQALLT